MEKDDFEGVRSTFLLVKIHNMKPVDRSDAVTSDLEFVFLQNQHCFVIKLWFADLKLQKMFIIIVRLLHTEI